MPEQRAPSPDGASALVALLDAFPRCCSCGGRAVVANEDRWWLCEPCFRKVPCGDRPPVVDMREAVARAEVEAARSSAAVAVLEVKAVREAARAAFVLAVALRADGDTQAADIVERVARGALRFSDIVTLDVAELRGRLHEATGLLTDLDALRCRVTDFLKGQP